jgi:RNA-directed DNA polymerase
MFDNIDHELLMRAVCKHTENKWIILYIKRWLKAPMQKEDGTIVERHMGTPQGGVISPILANLFMHYVFDVWMKREFPKLPWCRYADDGLVHCRTEQEAQEVKGALKKRLEECKLEMHPDKTRIVYCKDGARKKRYENTMFDFLGYTFRRRPTKNSRRNTIFLNFTPAVSSKALKSMRQTTRKLDVRNRTDLDLKELSKWLNPILRGWMGYYGKYSPSWMRPVFKHFNSTLIAWARRKYKRLRGHKTRTALFIERIAKEHPSLFIHWEKGIL